MHSLYFRTFKFRKKEEQCTKFRSWSVRSNRAINVTLSNNSEAFAFVSFVSFVSRRIFPAVVPFRLISDFHYQLAVASKFHVITLLYRITIGSFLFSAASLHNILCTYRRLTSVNYLVLYTFTEVNDHVLS